MKQGQSVYTREPDGSVQKWYVWAWIGNIICVSSEKSRRAAYKRYYEMSDVGNKLFLSRKAACKKDRGGEQNG